MTRPTLWFGRIAAVRRDGCRERGQSLVVFALFLTVLLGIGAFAVDVARVYSLQRYERSVADAAALAGAQDLQDNANTTNAGPADYPRARADALSLLNRELGGTASSPSCAGFTDVNGNFVNCPIVGTEYVVSIKTPSPSSVNVDPNHAVQVTVGQPQVPLTLARLFGQSTWNVGQTSVAGIDHASRYAVETLRPPLPKGPGDQNLQDINSNGTNTTLTVINGDIGTNTDAVANSGGTINLWDVSLQPSNGFYIWHIDPGITWNQTGSPPLPAGRLLPQLLPDPNYTIPVPLSSTPTYAPYTVGVDSGCLKGSVPGPGWTCLMPGVYPTNIHFNSSTNVYLEPGVYFFNGTLQADGQLVGGNQKGQPGVTLVFASGSQFKGNNSVLISLNAGTGDCASTPGDCPLAALQADGTSVPAPSVELPLLTLAVQKVSGCFAGTTPLNTCNNSTVLQLPGNGNLNVGGVTYAPSDSVQINGDNTTSQGLVGQIISWTIAYSGGARVSQYYPGTVGNGILHLDAACSGFGSVCYP